MQSLWLLYRLQARSSLRSLWKQLKTFKGAIRLIPVMVLGCFLFVPLVTSWFMADQLAKNSPQTMKLIRIGLPFVLALFFYTMIFRPGKNTGLGFSLPEIDFLFPAPLSRRDLLIYKLMSNVGAIVLLSVVMTMLGSMFLVRQNFVRDLAVGGCGIFMTFLFIRLSVIFFSLVGESVVLRFFTPLRKVIGLALGALVIVALFSLRGKVAWKPITNIKQLEPLLMGLADSTAANVLTGPFQMFANLILCDTMGGFFLWGLLCLLFNVLLFFAIVKLDANFLETSVRISQRQAEVLKNQGLSMLLEGRGGGTLPMLPYLNGTGPIAWRQLQTFYRVWKVGIFYVGLIIAMGGVMLWSDRNTMSSEEQFGLVISMLATMSFVATISLPIGFQSDVNKMDWFKSLPASNMQIAAGQLLGPTIVLTLLQYLYILIFFIITYDVWQMWLVTMLVLPVINFVLLSISNTLALLYPARAEAGMVKNLESLGSIVIFLMVQSFVGCVLVCSAAGAGGVGWYLTGLWPVAVVLSLLVMLVYCIVGVKATAWAFERFDVSKMGRKKMEGPRQV